MTGPAGDTSQHNEPERPTPEQLAWMFHDAYERLAPSFGYKTREASAVPWKDIPEPNRGLMVAVAAEILTALGSSPAVVRRPVTGDHGASAAMCECGHHWSIHAESNLTAQTAICHGYTGSATPGPLREPCRCTGFAQWTGPRDSRTGEPVKPLMLTIDARVAGRDSAGGDQ